jgi:hypothetical protein
MYDTRPTPRPGIGEHGVRAVALGIERADRLREVWSPAAWLAGSRAGLALLYAVPILFMAGYFFPPVNHDVATLIDVARRWLGGDRLYVDIIDVNPPLTMILHAVPVVLERWSGLAATTWWVMLMVGAVTTAALTCRRLIELAPYGKGHLARDAVPLIVLFIMAAAQAQEFGQREHLMLLAGIPYALLAGLRAHRPAPWQLAVPIAVAAGIGFVLKPYFLVIPALLEGYLLLRRGPRAALRDPVPWIIGAWVGIHAAIIFLLTPEYLTYTYPIAVGTYLSIGMGPIDVLFGSAMAATTIALLILTPMAFLRREPGFATLCLFAIGGVVSCVAQGKGWSYHTMPAVSGTIILLAALVIDQLDRWLAAAATVAPQGATALAASLLALVAYPYFLVNPPFAYQQRYEGSIARQLGDIIAVEAPNRRIMALSPGIYPFFPTVEYEKTHFAGRFATMWPIQGLYARCLPNGKLYRDLATAPAVEKQVFKAVVDDFIKARPDILFVDRIPGIPRCSTEVFDYLAYFSRDPRFAEAMQQYDFAYEFDRYNVWRRKRD